MKLQVVSLLPLLFFASPAAPPALPAQSTQTAPPASLSQPAQSAQPNVVLLFADDLGYGDLGCQGHPTIRSPHLDRMAGEGIRLTSFYAAIVCSPSRAALLTGRYPVRTGVFRVIGPDDKLGLPASEFTLAEALKTRGYRTWAVGKWHLGHDDPAFFPTACGFDGYLGLLYSNDMMPPWVETKRPLRLYRNTEPVDGPVDQATLTEAYTEEAIRFIRDAKAGPFFLYLAYTFPHVPLAASPRVGGSSARGLYGDVVEAIDGSAGRILDVLKREGLDENTLVIFTSDNGPWIDLPPRMVRTGGVKPWDAGSAGLLRGWKGTTYEGGPRVPFIARWPGKIPPGRVSAGIATSMDLYTTFLKLAGARVPADRPVDGMDLFDFLAGKAESPRREFLYFRGRSLDAVREGKWKLRLTTHLRQEVPDWRPPDAELFDLETDPSERFNLAGAHPELVARLRWKLGESARDLRADWAGETP